MAWRAINADIGQLRTVFEQLDGHQARVDTYRAKVERRVADPVRYLERQLGGRASLDGAEMRIEGVEDFIAFTHLRHLEYLPGAALLRRGYRIERRLGWVDNDWVRCPAFAVHRRHADKGQGRAA